MKSITRTGVLCIVLLFIICNQFTVQDKMWAIGKGTIGVKLRQKTDNEIFKTQHS
jgi:hypothetical protein